MPDVKALNPAQRREARESLAARYRDFQTLKMNLDMTRGKPCPEQLDLSVGLLDGLSRAEFKASDGSDCRNYGGLDGLPEAKALFAAYMGVRPEEIIIGGSSSLTLMHDAMSWAVLFGAGKGSTPWAAQRPVKFLCPSPGYDRHFAICEHLGIEMVPVDLRGNGPDMDAVERMAAEDASVKGIWCVPKYSNPTGDVYSDEVVQRLAGMRTKATDFRIFWDNAYCVHHLGTGPAPLADILEACRRAGHPERALLFGSTSKISFAGSGLAFMAGSTATMEWAKGHLGFQTIGPDKLNQLRHVRLFRRSGWHRTAHAAARRHPEAQVRRRAGGARPRTVGQGGGRVDPTFRRVLHQRRHLGWLRAPGDPAGGGGRGETHPGRVHLPVQAGPARPQHPHRPVLPAAGGHPPGDGGAGRVY